MPPVLQRARFYFLMATPLFAGPAVAPTVAAAHEETTVEVTPLEVGSRLESMHGVNLKLHEPRPMGIVLIFDRPWEGVTSGYSSVFQDHGIYRMYYRGSSDPSFGAPLQQSAPTCRADGTDSAHARYRFSLNAWAQHA